MSKVTLTGRWTSTHAMWLGVNRASSVWLGRCLLVTLLKVDFHKVDKLRCCRFTNRNAEVYTHCLTDSSTHQGPLCTEHVLHSAAAVDCTWAAAASAWVLAGNGPQQQLLLLPADCPSSCTLHVWPAFVFVQLRSEERAGLCCVCA